MSDLINHFVRTLAKLSVKRYDRIRVLRVIARRIYWALSDLYATLYPSLPGENPYPWPYSDPEFGNFGEKEDTLVVDRSGFIIRHSTSYCAYRMKRILGHWPDRVQPKRYDAKDWAEYLTDLGFSEVEISYNGASFLGVNPNVGEYGLVVWFEPCVRYEKTDLVLVSTYFKGEYCELEVRRDDYRWFLIRRNDR